MNELSNIKTYKIYSIFNNLLILGPIITLFFLAKGLSFTEIFLLNSIAAITTVLFEVPTGAVSDLLSRKLSLFIGSLLCFFSLIIYIVGPSFAYMILGEFIFAIGITFRSGTEQAILYDSLKNNGLEKDYPKIEGMARSYTFYAQAIGSLVAGFIYELDMYLPFYISAIFMIVAAVITLFFVEPLIEKEKHNGHYLAQIKSSFSYAFKHKKVFSVILFSVIFMYFYRVGFNYFQPYMVAVNIPVKYFGIIFFLFNIVAAYASKNADKFLKLTKPRSLMAISLLIAISFILLSISKIAFGLIFLFMQQLARGYRVPIFQKYINKHIPSDKRSTILSIQSFSSSIVIAILGPFAGLLLDHSNIFFAHLLMGVLMIFLLIFANIQMLNSSKVIELTETTK